MSRHEEEQPATPMARLMQTPRFNICILANMGFSTTIDVQLFKQEVERTLLKHTRFRSVLVIGGNKKPSWKRTSVEIKNHVFAPDLDPNMESPDEFVEGFMFDISENPMDMTRPLWEMHILNVKTSKANSTVIFKIHHSMGDGVCLISLLMACAKKTPGSNLATAFPIKKQKLNIPKNETVIKRLFMNVIWTPFLIVFNTVVGLLWILVTIIFLKDTETPIRGDRGTKLSSKRFVHRIIDFDDINLVKTAMNVTVNDVATGVVEAGLSRYLNKRYGQLSKENPGNVEKNDFLPRNLRLRSVVCFNLRALPIIMDLGDIMGNEKDLKGKWGNIIGIALVPLNMDMLHDPLTCVRRAKAAMDQKKLSLEPKSTSISLMLLSNLFGPQAAGAVANAIFRNTTLFLSNMVGPREEITPFGHPLCYIAPSVSGSPQALVVHFQSYADKFIISIAADEKLIPNPHQLCDDMVKSLQDIKESV